MIDKMIVYLWFFMSIMLIHARVDCLDRCGRKRRSDERSESKHT